MEKSEVQKKTLEALFYSKKMISKLYTKAKDDPRLSPGDDVMTIAIVAYMIAYKDDDDPWDLLERVINTVHEAKNAKDALAN